MEASTRDYGVHVDEWWIASPTGEKRKINAI